jgi:DNA-binding NarL/FixJ family response regulator
MKTPAAALHLSCVYRKLGIHSRTELAASAAKLRER